MQPAFSSSQDDCKTRKDSKYHCNNKKHSSNINPKTWVSMTFMSKGT